MRFIIQFILVLNLLIINQNLIADSENNTILSSKELSMEVSELVSKVSGREKGHDLGYHQHSSLSIEKLNDDVFVKINEIMSSNKSTVIDEDGDHSDWIELYNHGEVPVNLLGFGLSDNKDIPFRWIFPDTTILPNSFLLIWASGKDKKITGSPIHTNFSINAAGEEILFTSPANILIDEYAALAIPSNYSYGRQPDGTGPLVFFNNPTPGASNTSEGASELLQPVQFSQPSGIYSNDIELLITSTDPEATIIYTLDGSIPDLQNLEGKTYTYKNQYAHNPGDETGELLTGTYETYTYTSSINVSDKSAEPDQLTHISTTNDIVPYYFPDKPVRKGTVIRARAIKSGALPSEIATATYFVKNEDWRDYTLPIVSLAFQEDLFFDYEKGIYVAGKDFDDWREKNPDVKGDYGHTGNYRRSSDEYEVPGFFELFEPNTNNAAISQNIGIRIAGGYSRGYPLKSLRLYARSSYGEPQFNYPFFPDLPYTSYKRIVLRNSGNDYNRTMLRDAAIHTMVSHLNFDTQANNPMVVFLNGEYWGIHNARERYDKFYLQRKYNVDPENIDLLSTNRVAEEGDTDHFNHVLDYIDANDLESERSYRYIKTQLDIENFIDYQIAQIFVANTDWPGNNIIYWRLKIPKYEPNAPLGHDGRWRWLMYDTDFGFGLIGSFHHNTLSFATATNGPGWSNPEWSTFLLRNLLKNDSFKIQFVNRYADLLNSTFLPERTKDVIEQARSKIEPEMEEHILRWKKPENIDLWNLYVRNMNEFAEKRPDYSRDHLIEKFNFEGQHKLQVDVSNSSHGYIRVNTIDILESTVGIPENPYPWSGTYFDGAAITIRAFSGNGFKFLKWTGDEDIPAMDEVSIELKQNLQLTAVFIHESEIVNLISPIRQAQNVSIKPVLKWKNFEGAENYSLQVSASPYFTEMLLDSLVSSTEYTFSNEVSTFKTYYWRVKAQYGNNETEWSEIWKFTTVPAPPGTPTLISPESGSIFDINNVILKWHLDDQKAKFHLQISPTEDFQETIVNEENLDVLDYKAALDDNNEIYFWRVKALNQGGESSWSEVWNFSRKEDIVSATTEPYISEIKLFPNPNYGVLYIEHMVNQVDNIEIRDLTGRKIFEEKLEKGSHKSSVDISVLPKGIYLVRISNNKVILKQKKLIKI